MLNAMGAMTDRSAGGTGVPERTRAPTRTPALSGVSGRRAVTGERRAGQGRRGPL